MAAVVIGESGPDLGRRFRAAGLGEVVEAASLDAAVARGGRPGARAPGATAGELATVLLSPAAASFDMFVDYAARGRAFKDAVDALAAGRATGRDA